MEGKMGNRYLVTGVQLGMLIALCKLDANKCNEELNKIVENQMIWESKETLEQDVKRLRSEQSKENGNK